MAALLLAPQAALVHALSHLLPVTVPSSAPADDDGSHHAAKVCDLCLAFGQLAAALPSGFAWHAEADGVDLAATETVVAADLPVALAFRARAPPATSI